jgi:hypothetical protein
VLVIAPSTVIREKASSSDSENRNCRSQQEYRPLGRPFPGTLPITLSSKEIVKSKSLFDVVLSGEASYEIEVLDRTAHRFENNSIGEINESNL